MSLSKIPWILSNITGHVKKVTKESVKGIQGLKKVVNNFTREVVQESYAN